MESLDNRFTSQVDFKNEDSDRKFILRIKKCSSNFSARYELGRYPIDNFIKTQSLLYEDRLLTVVTPETLKESFSLSMSP